MDAEETWCAIAAMGPFPQSKSEAIGLAILVAIATGTLGCASAGSREPKKETESSLASDGEAGNDSAEGWSVKASGMTVFGTTDQENTPPRETEQKTPAPEPEPASENVGHASDEPTKSPPGDR